MAEKVGKGLAKGWRRVGEGLAQGWRRVGEGLADFLAPPIIGNFGIPEAPVYREQKRHIKLLHIKLFPVAPVTGPPGRVSGQKDLCYLGSEDST